MAIGRKSLLVSLSVPVIFLAVVLLSIFISGSFVKPDSNFVYFVMDNDNPKFGANHMIVNGKLKFDCRVYDLGEFDVDCNSREMESLEFFLYNTNTNESMSITIEQAKSFTYFDGLTSSDGYTVAPHYGTGGMFAFMDSDGDFFGGREEYQLLLKGKVFSKRINLSDKVMGYQIGYPNFVGWVK
ncbi:hypothetical protein HY844_00860 [Candidatus Berkelbacteria bacterium]|nr:hypothetical protein [Candidatus Berkelbacteria bacterium]